VEEYDARPNYDGIERDRETETIQNVVVTAIVLASRYYSMC
jgi:hypothetical protein